jgi:hypothetical protein
MVGKFAGGIVGRAYSGNNKTIFLENCYVDDTVVVEATSGSVAPYAGSFVGYSTTGASTKFDLKNCASLATKSDGTALNYAICGVNFDWYGELYYTVTNTFAHASKWHGLTTKGSATDSYLVTDLKTIKGESAKTNMPDLKWDEIWFTQVHILTTPVRMIPKSVAAKAEETHPTRIPTLLTVLFGTVQLQPNMQAAAVQRMTPIKSLTVLSLQSLLQLTVAQAPMQF